MKLNPKWTYPVLGLALLSMVFMGVLNQGPSGGGAAGAIAARVNDSEISRAEFVELYKAKSNKTDGQDKGNRLVYETFKQLIEKRALYETAKANGSLASMKEVTQKILKENPSISKADLEYHIRRLQYTSAQFAEKARVEESVRKLNNYIGKLAFIPSYEKKINYRLEKSQIELSYLKINKNSASFNEKISKDDLEKFLASDTSKKQIEIFYNNHRKDYQYEREVRVSNLLIAYKNDSNRKVTRNKKEAYKKIENMSKGAVFLDTAARVSSFQKMVSLNTDEPNGKTRKGDLGYVSVSSLEHPKELKEAALKLKKKGDRSAIIETKFGYHLLMATDVKEAKNISLETASPKIAKELLQKKQRRKQSNLVTDELLSSLEKKQDVSKLLKKYGLSWKKHTMALTPGRSSSSLPLQDFHSVGLGLSGKKSLAKKAIKKKDANYILKFSKRTLADLKEMPEENDNPGMMMFSPLMLQRYILLNSFRDEVLNKEFDVNGALSGKTSSKHKIYVNQSYFITAENNS